MASTTINLTITCARSVPLSRIRQLVALAEKPVYLSGDSTSITISKRKSRPPSYRRRQLLRRSKFITRSEVPTQREDPLLSSRVDWFEDAPEPPAVRLFPKEKPVPVAEYNPAVPRPVIPRPPPFVPPKEPEVINDFGAILPPPPVFALGSFQVPTPDSYEFGVNGLDANFADRLFGRVEAMNFMRDAEQPSAESSWHPHSPAFVITSSAPATNTFLPR